MKQFLYVLVAAVFLASCGSSGNNGSNVYVQAEAENVGENLNLQALGELVKSSSSAQDIETKLNAPNSINNLDLDGDGQVDYIKVTEYSNGNTRGFSFTVDLQDGSQEIASVEVEPNGNNATMSIAGNESIYGSGHYYTSHYTMADFMLWHYLMTPHVVYISPYRFGYYPSYYHPYASVPRSSYNSRVSTTTKTTTITKTTTKRASSSPNKNMTSSKATTRAKSLANPTTSQRSFQKNTGSSKPNTSGFKSGSSSSKPSSGGFKSSPSRSSGSSGSSRRSGGFGSSSRSSGRRR
jgi:hypothetical protein